MVSQSSRSPPTPLGRVDRPDSPRAPQKKISQSSRAPPTPLGRVKRANYPTYPIPIPTEKQPQALQLYRTFLLAEHLARATKNLAVGKSHDRYRLQVPDGAYIQSATASSGSSKVESSGLVDTSYLNAADSFSVVSFDDTQLEQKVKPHRRRKLVSPAGEKAALIRWLGSCWECRRRRVTVSLFFQAGNRCEG